MPCDATPDQTLPHPVALEASHIDHIKSGQVSEAIVTGLTTVLVLAVSLMVWALLLIIAHIAEMLSGIYGKLERQ